MQDFYKMPTWSTQEAKAKFSKLVHSACEEDQLITNRDVPIAVLVAKERYDKLTKRKESLLDMFLRAPLPEVEIEIERQKDTPREIDL